MARHRLGGGLCYVLSCTSNMCTVSTSLSMTRFFGVFTTQLRKFFEVLFSQDIAAVV